MTSDDLSDSAIALLCEIWEFELEEASPEQKSHLNELLSKGFVEIDNDAQLPDERYRVTEKAMRFISERGGGLNEA